MGGSYSRARLLLFWTAALGGPLGAPLLRLSLQAGALPLQEGEEPYPWEWVGSRSAGCEACQAIAELLLSSAISLGSSSSFGAAVIVDPHAISLGTISLKKERRETADQWLRRRQQAICGGGLMQLYAEQTETLHEAALSAACDSLFREKQETLLRLFHNPQQPPTATATAAAPATATAAATAAAELCLPSPCKSLWGEEDSPWGRLPQSLRNLRDSEIFFSLNNKNDGVQTLKSGLQIRWLHRRPQETPQK
ncbi:hypothetical protein ACSSS7_008168 [Eimeria intestinalis]